MLNDKVVSYVVFLWVSIRKRFVAVKKGNSFFSGYQKFLWDDGRVTSTGAYRDHFLLLKQSFLSRDLHCTERSAAGLWRKNVAYSTNWIELYGG